VARGDTNVVITMSERAFRTQEVVVTAEDPAVRIMRRVLERRARQRDTLRSYEYRLYTKFATITDTLTASRSSSLGDSVYFAILETYSNGYFAAPDRFYHEVVQKRQTKNIPPQANTVAFGTNVNAYDGEVQIINERVETPFADNALDVYDFTLESSEEDSIVRINASVKGLPRRAFEGSVYVDQRHDLPLEVRLTPTSWVNLPFGASMVMRQTFTESSGAVMPEAMSLRFRAEASILFVLEPRVEIDLETFCWDYRLNTPVDEDRFNARRVDVAPSADVLDETFWRENEKIPLRKEEVQGYAEIQTMIENPDSIETRTFLDRYIAPVTQTMARLGRRPFTGWDDVFHYNRVQGAYLGVGLVVRPDTALELTGRVGYGFSDQKPFVALGATTFLDRPQQWSIDLGYRSGLVRSDNSWNVRTPVITFTSLLFGNDYADYHYANGWEAGVSFGLGQMRFVRADVYERDTRFRLAFTSEDHRAAAPHDVWYLFSSGKGWRDNPQAIDGTLRSFKAQLFWNYNPNRTFRRNGVGIWTEISEPSVVPSSYTFRRVYAETWLRMPTLPVWTLDLLISGGWSWGSLPVQRFFSLESSVSGLASPASLRGLLVKEFYGDRMASLALVHNFGELVPGLLRIPNIASLGLEFLAIGGVAWTQFSPQALEYTRTALGSTDVTRERVYYEVGMGINRILLFFRLDAVARLSQRQHPQFFFSLSTALF
jgi:hypothetical protein